MKKNKTEKIRRRKIRSAGRQRANDTWGCRISMITLTAGGVHCARTGGVVVGGVGGGGSGDGGDCTACFRFGKMSRTTTTARRRNAQRGCHSPPPPPPIRPVRERLRTFLSCALPAAATIDPLPHARVSVCSLNRHHRCHRWCKVIRYTLWAYTDPERVVSPLSFRYEFLPSFPKNGRIPHLKSPSIGCDRRFWMGQVLGGQLKHDFTTILTTISMRFLYKLPSSTIAYFELKKNYLHHASGLTLLTSVRWDLGDRPAPPENYTLTHPC